MPCEQTCNPLAPSRGKHKECGCQAAVLNLPMSERFKPSNILLVAVSRACVYKQYGMAHVLCGVDKGGNQCMDMPCYARDMRALDEGVYTNIPDDVNGGSRRVRLRGWQTAIGADMLGAHSLGPFMESLSAHVFCRGCHVHQGMPHAYAPTSFFAQGARRIAPGADGEKHEGPDGAARSAASADDGGDGARGHHV